MGLMLVGGLSACKSKKKAAEAAKPPSGETELKVLCSGPEFFTDEKNFRSKTNRQNKNKSKCHYTKNIFQIRNFQNKLSGKSVQCANYYACNERKFASSK